MRQFSTFKVEGHLLGIDLLMVREINQQHTVTPVPHAPAHIRGFINLRGQIVTVFDLAVRLGGQPRELGRSSHIVVLKTDDQLVAHRARTGKAHLQGSVDPVGLLVDDIGDVVETDDDNVEPAPANVGDLDARFFAGVVPLARDLLLVLDGREVLKQD